MTSDAGGELSVETRGLPRKATDNQAARGRRELTLASGGSLVAAALVLFANGRPWIRFVVGTLSGNDVHATASGHDVAAAATALGLVMLAGVVALPASRRGGRTLVGGLIGLAGVGVGIAVGSAIFRPRHAAAPRAAAVAGLHDAVANAVTVTFWPWLALAGAVIAVLVGGLTALRSRRWPTMGRRYEAGREPARRVATDESSMWDRLDSGDDPTV